MLGKSIYKCGETPFLGGLAPQSCVICKEYSGRPMCLAAAREICECFDFPAAFKLRRQFAFTRECAICLYCGQFLPQTRPTNMRASYIRTIEFRPTHAARRTDACVRVARPQRSSKTTPSGCSLNALLVLRAILAFNEQQVMIATLFFASTRKS